MTNILQQLKYLVIFQEKYKHDNKGREFYLKEIYLDILRDVLRNRKELGKVWERGCAPPTNLKEDPKIRECRGKLRKWPDFISCKMHFNQIKMLPLNKNC